MSPDVETGTNSKKDQQEYCKSGITKIENGT